MNQIVEEKDEVRPLILTNTSLTLDPLDDRNKKHYIVDATRNLNLITYLCTSTLIIVLALVFINQCINDNIPLWTLFLILLIGHFVLFILMFNIMRCVYKSMQPESQDESSLKQHTVEKWHRTNEKIIPLIQYLLYNLLCIFWISSMLFIFEILVYLSLILVVPAYSFLIPIYIVAGLSLSNAVTCRSSSISSSISSLLVLFTAILLNLKINNVPKLSYSVVFIPTYIFLGYWIFICIYIFVCNFLQIFHLKNIQYQILVLFTTSFLVLMVADIGLMGYLVDPLVSKDCGGTILISCFFLVGFLFLSFALIFNVSNGIDLAIVRMGGEKPKILIGRTSGGWTVDENTSRDNILGTYLLIGDIEVVNHEVSPDTVDEKEINQNRNCSGSFVDLIFCYMLNKAQTSSQPSVASPRSSFSRASRLKTNRYPIQGRQHTEDGNNSSEPLLNDHSRGEES